MQEAVAGGAWWLNPRVAAIASIAPAVLALFLCAHQLTMHGVLHDVVLRTEGQNLGAAIGITRGALPYSSFPLAQPPGMAVLLLPLAGIDHLIAGSIALPMARIVTVAVTVIDVYLAGLLARPYGVPASLLTGVFTAIYPFEFFSTAGLTVGPYILLFMLAGLNLAFTEGTLATGGRALLAGLLLGYACTIKPWALIPAFVLACCAAVVWHQHRKVLYPIAGGLALGIVVPCLVFFMAAPTSFWRDVVITELPGHGTESAASKLAVVLGLGVPSGLDHPGNLGETIAALIVIVTLLTCLAGFKSSGVYDWFVAFSATGVLAAPLLPGSMSVQYGEFAMPLVALAVAMTVSRLVVFAAAAGSGRRTDLPSGLSAGLGAVLVGCAVVVGALGATSDIDYASGYANSHAIVDVALVHRTVPAGSCAISDNAALLIITNRFNSNLGICPFVVDPAGVAAIAQANPGSVRAAVQWAGWLAASSYLVLERPATDVPLGGGVHFDLKHIFVDVAHNEHTVVYANDSTRS